MKQKTQIQTFLVVLALIISIAALVISLNPKTIGHAVSDRDDIYYDDGYVGIGTDDPSELLHVDGDARIDENLYVHDNLSVDGYVGIGTDDPSTPLYIKTDDPDVTLDMDASSIYNGVAINFAKDGVQKARVEWYNNTNDFALIYDRYGTGNGDFKIVRHGNVRMTIKNSGKVGIGTNDPLGMLHINGTGIQLFLDSPSTGSGIYFAIGGQPLASIGLLDTGDLILSNDGGVIIDSLAGASQPSSYVCVYNNGTLYRKQSTCV